MRLNLYYIVLILAIIGIIFISGCGQQDQQAPQANSQDNSQNAPSGQGMAPTASKQCPSVYDGTYQGIFTYDYEVYENGEVARTGTDGVSLTVTLKCRSVDEENDEVYLDATHVIASDPYFGCQVGGCVPRDYDEFSTNRYEAQLPLTPTTATKPSKIGEGIMIYFPNGAWILTTNAEGDLHAGPDGMVLSNALTGGESWSAGKPIAPSPDPFPGIDNTYAKSFKSWTLSKTT